MQSKNNNEEMTIDLLELAVMLLGKLQWILLAGIVCGVAAYLYTTFFMTPMYQSRTSVYILAREDSNAAVTAGDLSLSTQLASDCSAIIKSRSVTGRVIEELGLNMSASSLSNNISVSSISDSSRIIEIVVTNSDPLLAQRIADCIREVVVDNLVEIMNLETVNVIDSAILPTAPSSPNKTRNTLIGFLAGMLICAAVFVLIHIMNNKIETQDDIERYLGLSVLGTIPDSNKGMNTEESVTLQKMSSPSSKSIKNRGTK